MKYPKIAKAYRTTPLAHLPDIERAAIADQILSRYLAGEEIATICQTYDISHVTAYALLVSCREDVWKDISVARALSRYAAAENELDMVREKLDKAKDLFELGKAREITRLCEAQLKSNSWMLEKLYRRLFGDDAGKQLGQGVVQINITGIDRTSSPVTLEGEAGTE
jgi:hypothetical protein